MAQLVVMVEKEVGLVEDAVRDTKMGVEAGQPHPPHVATCWRSWLPPPTCPSPPCSFHFLGVTKEERNGEKKMPGRGMGDGLQQESLDF